MPSRLNERHDESIRRVAADNEAAIERLRLEAAELQRLQQVLDELRSRWPTAVGDEAEANADPRPGSTSIGQHQAVRARQEVGDADRARGASLIEHAHVPVRKVSAELSQPLDFHREGHDEEHTACLATNGVSDKDRDQRFAVAHVVGEDECLPAGKTLEDVLHCVQLISARLMWSDLSIPLPARTRARWGVRPNQPHGPFLHP